jgi:uncharacterized protein (DUF302 family)
MPGVEVVTKMSDASVDATVERFLRILAAKKVKVFAVIDQREEARNVQLDLRETVLIVFGDPRAGTPAMVAVPSLALDLPLKVLIWSDEGRTTVSYESPSSLASRHGLSEELGAPLRGIDALTDALVSDSSG